jgi:branched-chain amino acid transport system ATP-binding protein
MTPHRAHVEVDGVSIAFGGVTALSRLSFAVAKSEIFAIIGPNGAGKTTLFNCLSTICRPQEGSIRVDGSGLVGAPAGRLAQQGIARTFQNLGLFEYLDPIDNILLGRHPLMTAGFVSTALRLPAAVIEEAEHRQAANKISDMLGLEEYHGRPCADLPYGVRKLVELGRALAAEPRLLLLDEPVAGMNFEERKNMADHIRHINARSGATILLVEHDMSFVMNLVSRILVLDFGEAIACGTPNEIQADRRVIDAYLGTSVSSDFS